MFIAIFSSTAGFVYIFLLSNEIVQTDFEIRFIANGNWFKKDFVRVLLNAIRPTFHTELTLSTSVGQVKWVLRWDPLRMMQFFEWNSCDWWIISKQIIMRVSNRDLKQSCDTPKWNERGISSHFPVELIFHPKIVH